MRGRWWDSALTDPQVVAGSDGGPPTCHQGPPVLPPVWSGGQMQAEAGGEAGEPARRYSQHRLGLGKSWGVFSTTLSRKDLVILRRFPVPT